MCAGFNSFRVLWRVPAVICIVSNGFSFFFAGFLSGFSSFFVAAYFAGLQIAQITNFP